MKICPAIQLVLKQVTNASVRKLHLLDLPLNLTLRACGTEIKKKMKITIKQDSARPNSL
jgi:hypothetical protein